MATGAKRAIGKINQSGGLFGNDLKLNKPGTAARKSDIYLSVAALKDVASLSRTTRDAVTGLTTTLSDTAYSFNYSGQIETWQVPEDGTYSITALGALGGGTQIPGYASPAGLGALVGASFDLSATQTLDILVGQAGANNIQYDPIAAYGSGGGGGTYVVSTPSEALVVAGGGGGAGSGYNGQNAQLTPDGGTTGVSSGGMNGSGGTIGADSNYYGGAGGGGFVSGDGGNGGSHYSKNSDGDVLLSQGGFSFLNGGYGGVSARNGFYFGQPGGFGGGGGGGGNGKSYTGTDIKASGGGGGGGGYSGGGGGVNNNNDGLGGGGGGTYISPGYDADILTPANIPDTNPWQNTGGNGFVSISFLDPSSTSQKYSVQLSSAGSGSRWRQKGTITVPTLFRDGAWPRLKRCSNAT